jgi:hypothetical protein
MMDLYYCVLKNYKGLFKKKHIGNTHLFLIPISDKEYLYLGMIGEIEDEKGNYLTQLIVKLPEEIVDQVIDEEINYFKDRFVVVEELRCSPSKLGAGEYNIKIPNKGDMILSDIHVEFNVDVSTNARRIYTITGDFDFESEDIKSTSDMKMIAAKKLAYMGGENRYDEIMKESFNLKRF